LKRRNLYGEAGGITGPMLCIFNIALLDKILVREKWVGSGSACLRLLKNVGVYSFDRIPMRWQVSKMTVNGVIDPYSLLFTYSPALTICSKKPQTGMYDALTKIVTIFLKGGNYGSIWKAKW
jgi:hypothetical protein